MAYGDFKDLKRRTPSDKVLTDKAFNIARNCKCDGYQRGLASMVYKFFDKSSKGSGVNIPIKFNRQLAKELHKQIIRNFRKRKIYSRFKDNIWDADLADMQLISKIIKDLYFHYVLWIFLVNMLGLFLSKVIKGVSIVDVFQKILDDSNRKPNKKWVDKRSEF